MTLKKKQLDKYYFFINKKYFLVKNKNFSFKFVFYHIDLLK